MTFRAICVAFLFSTLPMAGCGTAANLVRSHTEEGGRTPFGGVRQDLDRIEKTSDGDSDSTTRNKKDSDQYPQAVFTLFCAVDLPFSLVGDIVTWPYTAAYTYINQPVPVPPVITAATPTTSDSRPQTLP